MPYDRDSFLAGLAVGRTLWRPHRDLGNVTPPVGWTADPEYLIYDADLWLASQFDDRQRDYYKAFNGKAIGIYAIGYKVRNTYGVWQGPILISPDSSAATLYYYWMGKQTAWPTGQVDYLGITWRYNTSWNYNGVPREYDTSLIEYTAPEEGQYIQDLILAVMEEAHVRVFAGG